MGRTIEPESLAFAHPSSTTTNTTTALPPPPPPLPLYPRPSPPLPSYGGYQLYPGATTTATATTSHHISNDPLIPPPPQQQPTMSFISSSSPIHQRRNIPNNNNNYSIPVVTSPTTTHTLSSSSTSSSLLHASNNNHKTTTNTYTTTTPPAPPKYRHNTMIAILWVPCWCSVYGKFRHGSTLVGPIVSFTIATLLIYGIDLAHRRRTDTLYAVWITTTLQIITNVWFQLLQITDGTDDGIEYILWSVAVHAIFFVATACWYTLQCQWLIPISSSASSSNPDHPKENDHDDHYYDRDCTFRQMESIVHGTMPPVFAALATFSMSNWLEERSGSLEVAAMATPYLFLLFMTMAMLMVGALPSTLSNPNTAIMKIDTVDRKSEHQSHDSMDDCCISPAIAQGHVRLLTYLPGCMQILNSWNRIIMSQQHVTYDDVYDLLLTLTIPYLTLIFVVKALHTTNILVSPYGRVLSHPHQEHHRYSPPRKVRDPMILAAVAFLASWSIQQRYLISMCHSFSYHFVGTQIATWQCTLYWSLTTLFLFAVVLIWGRTDPTTNQLLFGEYHEDVVQLMLSAVGLCLGKAFGLPWSMTPLPILGILGFIFWINTRMLRYLSIVLFVIHSIGVVVFTYRYVGIDQTFSLPLPKFEVSLVRFGMMLTTLTVAIGFITGLAVRSSGGYMASLFKKLDVVGVLSILYTILLMILEITLLKRPVPLKELAVSDFTAEDADGTLYDVPMVLLTSLVLMLTVLFMKRIRMLHEWSAAVILSLSMGKVIAIYTYTIQSDLGIGNYHIHDIHGTNIVYRALIATILCATMFVPRVFLEPVRLKTFIRGRRASSSIAGRASGATIPPHAVRLIGLYAFIFVPTSLIATLPYVVFPFISAVRAQFTQTSYYVSSPPLSELIGSAAALWGLSMVSMLNHFLPDGGAEAWKKLSSLVFLMGLGIYFIAPTIVLGEGSAMYNPYAPISSVGRQLIIRWKVRTAGWGIISAALATLLAVSGPLELKERVYPSGRKDKYLLLRTMIFCFLFGGGLSWFIVLQCMSESEWILVILTVLAAMVLAFLGTVATVLGYYLEVQNFDDIDQIAKTWMYGFVVFIPITGIPHLLFSDTPHWFGPGGWLTPYLGVASLTSFSFTLSLLYRRGKSSQTKGLGNTACVTSWLLSNIILYGRNGIAGLEPSFDVSTFLGIPLSVVGTILLSSILLALDGESTSSSSRGRGGGRATVTASVRIRNTFWRLNLHQLGRNSQWFPMFAGSFTIFMLATNYAIFVRGSGLMSLFDFTVYPSHDATFVSTIYDTEGENDIISTLVRNALAESLDMSVHLDRTSFWTSPNGLGPALHFLGSLSVIPSFILLLKHYWWNKTNSTYQITAGIPLNAIPIVLCRNIPSLTAAAILTLLCSIMQLIGKKQSEHASRMRI